MSECPHPNVIPDVTVYRLADPSAPGGVRWTMHARVFCVACQQPFRFRGNMPLAPSGLEEAIMTNLGAWVSVTGDELGVIVTPDIEPGVGLDQMEMAGRA